MDQGPGEVSYRPGEVPYMCVEFIFSDCRPGEVPYMCVEFIFSDCRPGEVPYMCVEFIFSDCRPGEVPYIAFAKKEKLITQQELEMSMHHILEFLEVPALLLNKNMNAEP
ncbi:hypothetical protein Bbelb_369060 [Branchiostoma belcheri]|nr:hypothetical protein Bbelb_369060 [Branchiostoma belcheri]